SLGAPPTSSPPAPAPSPPPATLAIPETQVPVDSLSITSIPPAAFEISVQELDQLAGEYELVSSHTDESAKDWKFTKGWLIIQRLSQDHFGFIQACGWSTKPTSMCGDRWVLKYANGKFYRIAEALPPLEAIAVFPTLGQIHLGSLGYYDGRRI